MIGTTNHVARLHGGALRSDRYVGQVLIILAAITLFPGVMGSSRPAPPASSDGRPEASSPTAGSSSPALAPQILRDICQGEGPARIIASWYPAARL